MQTTVVFNVLPAFVPAVRETDATARAICAAALVPVAQDFCPISPGDPADGTGIHMMETIAVNPDDPTQVIVDKLYAVFVHEGTTKLPARPFCNQAIDAQRDTDLDIMSRVVPEAARAAGAR